MRRATARRARVNKWRPSFLPERCGEKLPTGRLCWEPVNLPGDRCIKHRDPNNRQMVPAYLSPFDTSVYYLWWLEAQAREPVHPDDVRRFITWWIAALWVDELHAPSTVNWDGFKKLWLRWCELTGRPVLVPFDVTLFCQWWRVT